MTRARIPAPRRKTASDVLPGSRVREMSRLAGRPLDPALRGQFEAGFGHDFSRVLVHRDAAADHAAREINADAYTLGNDIVFAADRYRPDTVGGRRLLAHELAHVAQQRGSSPGEAALGADPGSAEREADRAAQTLLGGRVPPRLSAQPAMLYRAVKTNGGEFDTTAYTAINDAAKAKKNGVGKRVGAHIDVQFKPNDLVETDLIGMVQSVRTLKAAKAGGAVDTPDFPTKHKGSFALGKGDSEPGRAIDQTDTADKTDIPNTSPLYAVESSAATIPKTLTDVVPVAASGFGDHGHRARKPGGGFDVKNASLNDTPSRRIEFPKQEWKQTFEVSALILSGPMANTYLGSVEWGWTCDAAGNATLDPAALKFVRAGMPTSPFFEAAKKWNEAKTVKDPKSKKELETVDLPVPADSFDSGARPAAERSTGQLLLWRNLNESELKGAKDVEKTNKDFDRRAIDKALATRQALVEVKVVKTEDWTGADEVYIKLDSGTRQVKTAVKSLNDGQTGNYTVPVAALLPVKEAIRVQAYDEDTGILDDDDLIVDFSWQPPFGPRRNTKSYDQADYKLTIKFNK